MSPRGTRDQGAAAVETALVLTLLLAITGLVAPLPVALLEKSKVERAAAQAARWATSAPPAGRPLSRGAADDAVLPEVLRALEDSGSRVAGVTATMSTERADHCPLRVRRTVVVSGTVDLGPLSTLYAAVPGAGAPGLTTLTARATACDE